MKSRPHSLLICLLAGSALLLVSMIDRVNPEGDHVSYLVLAPHPTLGFRYGGGESGAWRQANPGQKDPWWLTGRYLILLEITDS